MLLDIIYVSWVGSIVAELLQSCCMLPCRQQSELLCILCGLLKTYSPLVMCISCDLLDIYQCHELLALLTALLCMSYANKGVFCCQSQVSLPTMSGHSLCIKDPFLFTGTPVVVQQQHVRHENGMFWHQA